MEVFTYYLTVNYFSCSEYSLLKRVTILIQILIEKSEVVTEVTSFSM